MRIVCLCIDSDDADEVRSRLVNAAMSARGLCFSRNPSQMTSNFIFASFICQFTQPPTHNMLSQRSRALSPLLKPNLTPRPQLRPASNTAPAPDIQSQVPMPAITRTTTAEQHRASIGQKPRPNDAGLYITAGLLFFFTPPIIVYWWNHRSEHMSKKKELLLEEVRVKRAEFEAFRRERRGERERGV